MDYTIRLIGFSAQHIQKTFEWISEPELRRMFLMRGEPSWEEHVAYCNRILADPKQSVYAICFGEEHVGNCGFKNIIEKTEGELWIYMGSPLVRGKGVGTSATKLLLEEGFRHLDLSMIYLHVADFNVAAHTVYEKLGFVEVPLRGDASDWAGRDCRIIRMELEKK